MLKRNISKSYGNVVSDQGSMFFISLSCKAIPHHRCRYHLCKWSNSMLSLLNTLCIDPGDYNLISFLLVSSFFDWLELNVLILRIVVRQNRSPLSSSSIDEGLLPTAGATLSKLLSIISAAR
jgi:hypothetical protein